MQNAIVHTVNAFTICLFYTGCDFPEAPDNGLVLVPYYCIPWSRCEEVLWRNDKQLEKFIECLGEGNIMMQWQAEQTATVNKGVLKSKLGLLNTYSLILVFAFNPIYSY